MSDDTGIAEFEPVEDRPLAGRPDAPRDEDLPGRDLLYEGTQAGGLDLIRERPVFAIEDGDRRRRFARHVGIGWALVTCLWIAAVLIGALGFGSFPRLGMPRAKPHPAAAATHARAPHARRLVRRPQPQPAVAPSLRPLAVQLASAAPARAAARHATSKPRSLPASRRPARRPRRVVRHRATTVTHRGLRTSPRTTRRLPTRIGGHSRTVSGNPLTGQVSSKPAGRKRR